MRLEAVKEHEMSIDQAIAGTIRRRIFEMLKIISSFSCIQQGMTSCELEKVTIADSLQGFLRETDAFRAQIIALQSGPLSDNSKLHLKTEALLHEIDHLILFMQCSTVDNLHLRINTQEYLEMEMAIIESDCESLQCETAQSVTLM